jgi:outer membrane protein TolC
MVIRAENGRELALATLAQLLGLDAEVELTLHETSLNVTVLPDSFDEALDQAVATRPELEQARRSVMMAERQVDQAEAGILPTADLFARGWYDSPEIDFDGSRENWALGVSLNWSFYDGGRRGAGVDRSKARLDEMRRADRKAMLAVQMDVKSAWVRLDDARQRLEVAASAVGNAEETLQLVQARYESGAATVTRYLEAELMSTKAKMRRTNAAFDLERAKAGLVRAIGAFSNVHADEVKQ